MYVWNVISVYSEYLTGCVDYVMLPRRMLGRLLDVKVWRGKGGGIVWPFLGGSSAEIGGWLEECREDGGCEKCVEGEWTES